jgi:hypothetical protein
LIMIPCEDAPPFKTVIDTINYIKTHTK